MKTIQRIHNQSKSLTVAGALAAAALLLLSHPTEAAAAKANVQIVDLDETYVDDSSFCEPVLVHQTGRLVVGIKGTGQSGPSSVLP